MSNRSSVMDSWAVLIPLLSCISIACYEIVPIEPGDTTSSDGTGGANTGFTSSSSTSGTSTGGSGKVGVSASASSTTVSTSASSTDAASSSLAQYIPTKTCKSLTYEGICSTALGLAIHWREDSAIQDVCDPDDPVPAVGDGFCAVSFCTNDCSPEPCTPSSYSNHACWADSPSPSSQACSAFVGTCQDGVAFAANPADAGDCLIRDCNDESRDCEVSNGVARCVDP